MEPVSERPGTSCAGRARMVRWRMPAAYTDLPPARVLLPFEAGPWRVPLAMRARDPAGLIDIDALYPAQMALRRRLLAERHNEVFGATPGSAAARAEVLALLGTLLPARFPQWFSRDGAWLHNRLTGETWDLGELWHRPAGGRRTAGAGGSVCHRAGPRAGRRGAVLSDPLAAGRQARPVTRRRARAGAVLCRAPGGPVDRLIGRLPPGRLVRAGELVAAGRLRAVPARRHGGRRRPVTAANAGERLFLRTERQSFSRCRAGRCCSPSGSACTRWRRSAPGRRRPHCWPRGAGAAGGGAAV